MKTVLMKTGTMIIPYHRVSDDFRCPVCGKPDWCLVSEDGRWVICPRTAEGAVCQLSCGYLHRMDGPNSNLVLPRRKLRASRKPAPLNWQALVRLYQQKLGYFRCRQLARQLGLRVNTLRLFGIGWDGSAYTIPVWEHNEIVGILQRFPDGQKRLVRGSKGGIYHRADGYWLNGALLICEGLSDTMVAVECGFEAVGRFNCLANKNEITEILKGRNTMAIIVADNDQAGLHGSIGLMQTLLEAGVKTLRLVVPDSYKDLRDWYSRAGKREVQEAIAKFIEVNNNEQSTKF